MSIAELLHSRRDAAPQTGRRPVTRHTRGSPAETRRAVKGEDQSGIRIACLRMGCMHPYARAHICTLRQNCPFSPFSFPLSLSVSLSLSVCVCLCICVSICVSRLLHRSHPPTPLLAHSCPRDDSHTWSMVEDHYGFGGKVHRITRTASPQSLKVSV